MKSCLELLRPFFPGQLAFKSISFKVTKFLKQKFVGLNFSSLGSMLIQFYALEKMSLALLIVKLASHQAAQLRNYSTENH